MFVIVLAIVIIKSAASSDASSDKVREITIVTSFFDIGRGNWEKFNRSRDNYFSYFKQWARLTNDLVVFCQNEKDQNEVLSIRKGYSLENKTRVVIIDDLFSIEKDIYDRMVNISKDPYFLEFRLKDLPENKAEYNLINCLKSYFIYRADLEFDLKTDDIAWIDFGFNHMNQLYTHEEDWSFHLECNTSSEKITMYYYTPKLDERPLFEIIRTVHPNTLTGGFIAVPRKLAKAFWMLSKESLYEMVYMGLMDQDQHVHHLASRHKPDMFEMKKSHWFEPIRKDCNGGHMRINKDWLPKEVRRKRFFFF